MSVDYLQICIVDCNQIKYSPHNVISDFNSVVENINGLTKAGISISFADNVMQLEIQNPVYGATTYLTEANAINLRNNFIMQIATIKNFQSYKDIVIRSYRNDLQASDRYITGINDGLEIFIFKCKFQSLCYVEPSNIDILLSRVNNALDAIPGLEFAGIVASSSKATNDDLFIGIDDATFNGNKYLTLLQATTLRNSVINAMASVNELDDTNIEVEIKISKNDNQASN
jgi:hypothetical protein